MYHCCVFHFNSSRNISTQKTDLQVFLNIIISKITNPLARWTQFYKILLLTVSLSVLRFLVWIKCISLMIDMNDWFNIPHQLWQLTNIHLFTINQNHHLDHMSDLWTWDLKSNSSLCFVLQYKHFQIVSFGSWMGVHFSRTSI